MTLLIGIPACAVMVRGAVHHSTPARYAAALRDTLDAIPVMIPPIGADALHTLDRLDGLLLSGSPSNVEPAHYGAADETPGQHDPARDGTTFPLIHAALRRGVPLFGICRGIQELNVALGGSLHQQVHGVHGRRDHRGGSGTREERYAPKHDVMLSGSLRAMIGSDTASVNSVHEQAIDRLAVRLEAEAVAPDGTVEGVRVRDAGFAIAVQWHPEWNAAHDPVSLALFAAFGEACRAYADGVRRAA